MKKKKAYVVQEEDADYCVAVVAYSSKEAKKLAWGNEAFEDAEWIDVKVNWKKGVDVSNLKLGVIEDYLLALKLGLYGHIDYEECPKCNAQDATVYYDNGDYYCSSCEGS